MLPSFFVLLKIRLFCFLQNFFYNFKNVSCDLIGFGRAFINNPDLVARLEHNYELSQNLKMDLFYTSEAHGYIDYPVYKEPIILQIQ